MSHPTFDTEDERTAACERIANLCKQHGKDLWAKIVARAQEEGGDYRDALDTWLIQGSTLRLRDILCAPFGPMMTHDRRDLFNAFANIDSAGLNSRMPNADQEGPFSPAVTN